jgi:hypothetical protein
VAGATLISDWQELMAELAKKAKAKVLTKLRIDEVSSGSRCWRRGQDHVDEERRAVLEARVLAGGARRGGQDAAEKDYGKSGDPIDLVIGYQPYYTESWSGLIMRDKKFYGKYLPKGSAVDLLVSYLATNERFKSLQGAAIVNGMLEGKFDIGYVGDMPAIVSTSHADVRDLRRASIATRAKASPS